MADLTEPVASFALPQFDLSQPSSQKMLWCAP